MFLHAASARAGAALVIAWGSVLSATSSNAGPSAARVDWIGASSAHDCEGALLVAFRLERRAPGRPRQLEAVHDDGGPATTRLEVRDVSGRQGPGGAWLAPQDLGGGSVGSGGEGWLRWPDLRTASQHGAHLDAVRVIRQDTGLTSTATPIAQGCAK